MVEQVTFQTIFQFLQTVGILVAVSIYIASVRNQSRARKMVVARQVSQDLTTVEYIEIFAELLEMEWDDFDDFLRKYDSSVNRDNYAKRTMMWTWYDRLGYDLYRGEIDSETLYNLILYQGTLLLWHKFRPIILEHRERYGYPEYLRWFEYLVVELGKERVKQGLPPGFTDVDRVTSS